MQLVEMSVVLSLWHRMTAMSFLEATSESSSQGLLKSGCYTVGRLAKSAFRMENACCCYMSNKVDTTLGRSAEAVKQAGAACL
ncbi:hypothetical protein BGW37DRAFT_484576 [Umbelopsis sp. PMI_123]|nr:hypothetical protein BGW37DRAFT_484576 [Umbelopsis sp. PMI_123]